MIALILGLSTYFISIQHPLENNEPEIEEVIITTINEGSKSVIKVVHKMVNGDQYLTKTSSAVIMLSDDNYYYAVTNYHGLIKENYQTYSIELSDYLNNVYPGEIVELNQAEEIISNIYDLGLLRFEKPSYELSIPIIRYSPLNLTTNLTAIGYPDGIRTVTTGNYSRMVKLNDFTLDLIEHSTEIYHGNSGGGLFDNNGKILGINSAGLFDDNGSFVNGYAIPIQKVLEYINLFSY